MKSMNTLPAGKAFPPPLTPPHEGEGGGGAVPERPDFRLSTSRHRRQIRCVHAVTNRERGNTLAICRNVPPPLSYRITHRARTPPAVMHLVQSTASQPPSPSWGGVGGGGWGTLSRKLYGRQIDT